MGPVSAPWNNRLVYSCAREEPHGIPSHVLSKTEWLFLHLYFNDFDYSLIINQPTSKLGQVYSYTLIRVVQKFLFMQLVKILRRKWSACKYFILHDGAK